ncbi:MAG: cohesin domain-containing protein [bacterium]|nr:cohesin domain-containing protein [bacterium]
MENIKNNFMRLFVIFLFIFICIAIPQKTLALSYDLIPPSGTLNRGDDVQFTMTVNTDGQSVSSAQIGMTYDATLLQYVSTTLGDTFTTVDANTSEGGKIIFNASNTAGFNGTGNFAVVTFKIIASASGKTDICVLFNPSTTPTSSPQTTKAPQTQPTALPQTGSTDQFAQGATIAFALLLVAGSGMVLFKKH